ncbi:MAG: hypothetical protein NZM42_00260 [Gemmatales bacterium]|nr:hypothetical protein [Gemmatales bacterium]MDW8221771.1 hypothetical protein [Gemmatales bacterium]
MHKTIILILLYLSATLLLSGCSGDAKKPQLSNLSPQQQQQMERSLQGAATDERQRLSPDEAQRHSLHAAEEEERRR